MIRFLALAALAPLMAGSVRAQEPASLRAQQQLIGEPTERAGMAPAARVFAIRDGRLWLDGRPLPADAIPDGLDLSGVTWEMELVGAATPAVEVDGVWFVLEHEKLVPYEASEKAGKPVYVMGTALVQPESATADMLEPVVDQAYLRQLSDADRALYDQLHEERRLEVEVQRIARRVRALPPGAEYDALAAELRDGLAALFDLKQDIRRAELTRAESELRALRAVMGERETMRGEIIEHRFHELMGTAPLDR